MYVRVSCSSPQPFYSKIPIYSCSYMSGVLEKYHICDISSTREKVVMFERRSRKYCMYVCTFGCRAHHPRRFIQRYLYILAPTCQATRKVSYIRYKQHLGESCNVTTTFKKVLYVRMYVRVSCSPSQTFYSKIPIYSCSHMSGLLEKYHICDISST